MQLTLEEFIRIRPLHWHTRVYGGKTYNTPVDEIQTQLFWIDFLRLVFAPKFKSQNGVQQINNFDYTMPVLITDDRRLVLPTQMETAMYFANNQTLPMKFSIPIKQITILVLAIVIIITTVVCHALFNSKLQWHSII